MGEKGMMDELAGGAATVATTLASQTGSLVERTIEGAGSLAVNEAGGLAAAIKAEAVGAVAKGTVDEGRSRLHRTNPTSDESEGPSERDAPGSGSA